ncbi:MAG TPA: hypothetical protein PLJ43_13445, partial [Chitinophagales bacterium]|nr:hypothetical protein [Chitinophagales bacterium]
PTRLLGEVNSPTRLLGEASSPLTPFSFLLSPFSFLLSPYFYPSNAFCEINLVLGFQETL